MPLTKDDAVQIHDRLIAEHGGTSGILNERMIEFAVATASRKKDPVYEAASVLEFIAKNHPFTDGNKRTAFASAATVLRLDGRALVAQDEAAIGFMLEVSANGLTLAEIASWLKDRLERLEEAEAHSMKPDEEDRPGSEEETKRSAIQETLEAHKELMKKLSKL